MAIRYSIEVRETYIYFLGEGTEESLADNISIDEMIVRTCKEHNRKRVLVDDRNVTYTASTLSIYELARHYERSGLALLIERAAVIANPKYEEENLFFETAARNRGINVQLFKDVESAEKWLTT